MVTTQEYAIMSERVGWVDFQPNNQDLWICNITNAVQASIYKE